mmetsp:Transcript_27696/g.31756  ORF Transcript_27696/g.31756 Transcript_27696/m.31756 type:complete len:82 (+) Transcript_27696:32-277(+)
MHLLINNVFHNMYRPDGTTPGTYIKHGTKVLTFHYSLPGIRLCSFDKTHEFCIACRDIFASQKLPDGRSLDIVMSLQSSQT